MLGLPIVTGLCGFKLSLLIFILSWAFMTTTGLLLVEANGWFNRDIDLISMLDYSLGKWTRKAGWILYLFLFYSLLVAYLAGLGITCSLAVKQFFAIPTWTGSIFFAVLVTIILSFGIKYIDICNRILMTAKIGSFLAIIGLGIFFVNRDLLQQTNSHYIFYSLPIMVISFGFHNLIPTMTKYMQGNLKRVRLVIFFGSLFALIIYLLWDFMVLGIVAKDGEYGIINSLKFGRDAAHAVANILSNSWVAHFAAGLSFFSYLTSLMIQSLALTHFLNDGFKQKFSLPALIAISILPPLVFSILNPTIFFKALDFAGGICAVILFGVLPVLMVWNGRYSKKLNSSRFRMFGGKPLLIIVFLFAIFVISFQIKMMIFSNH